MLKVDLNVEEQRPLELKTKFENEMARRCEIETETLPFFLLVAFCQQELEKIQWDKENFLIENEKRWKELENQKKSGLILDVVRKEKAVAYSFNC